MDTRVDLTIVVLFLTCVAGVLSIIRMVMIKWSKILAIFRGPQPPPLYLQGGKWIENVNLHTRQVLSHNVILLAYSRRIGKNALLMEDHLEPRCTEQGWPLEQPRSVYKIPERRSLRVPSLPNRCPERRSLRGPSSPSRIPDVHIVTLHDDWKRESIV